MENMKTVEIYIGTDLRGPAKGEGKVIYIMRTLRRNRQVHESMPAVRAEYPATESRLVLLALRDALLRILYACEVVVYTECTYMAAAINNMWPAGWQKNNWINARGQQVKDWYLWECIMQELEAAGHILRAVSGKHEFSAWMRYSIPHLAADKESFTAIEQKNLNLVSDRIGS